MRLPLPRQISRASVWTGLVFLAAALLVMALPVPGLAAPVARTLHIDAGDSAFSPAVAQVNPGDRVTIELTARDVTHSLAIDGYAVDLQAEPGQTARVTFTAARAGSFKIRCNVACGNLHPFMTGRFNVGSNVALIRAAGLAMLVFLFGVWRGAAHGSSR